MIEYRVGEQGRHSYDVVDIDEDFFEYSSTSSTDRRMSLTRIYATETLACAHWIA